MLKTTTHDSEWQPKYFASITGIFCGLYIITSVLVPKMIVIFGLILPAGIITFPLCCIITDLLTEIYGFNRTRQAIWAALTCTILYAIFSQIAIILPSANFWEQNQSGFEAYFSTSWRIAAAGCLAWVVGEFTNSYIMSRLKIFQNAKHMSFRFIGSTIVGQFFDTTVFMTVAFAGTMPWDAFFIMAITGWLFKVGYEIVALPLSVPIAKWVKRKEGVEHFDKQEISLI